MSQVAAVQHEDDVHEDEDDVHEELITHLLAADTEDLSNDQKVILSNVQYYVAGRLVLKMCCLFKQSRLHNRNPRVAQSVVGISSCGECTWRIRRHSHSLK